jgi:hypothetical protein
MPACISSSKNAAGRVTSTRGARLQQRAARYSANLNPVSSSTLSSSPPVAAHESYVSQAVELVHARMSLRLGMRNISQRASILCASGSL